MKEKNQVLGHYLKRFHLNRYVDSITSSLTTLGQGKALGSLAANDSFKRSLKCVAIPVRVFRYSVQTIRESVLFSELARELSPMSTLFPSFMCELTLLFSTIYHHHGNQDFFPPSFIKLAKCLVNSWDIDFPFSSH